MLVKLVFVPPGGGEADYSMDFEMPAIPQPGDYISIRRGTGPHTEDFLVRRTWWSLEYPETDENSTVMPGQCGGFLQASVECEFAIGHFSSEDHKNTCYRYKEKTGHLREFDDSMY